jgi:uncharacterized membrane protein YhdT
MIIAIASEREDYYHPRSNDQSAPSWIFDLLLVLLALILLLLTEVSRISAILVFMASLLRALSLFLDHTDSIDSRWASALWYLSSAFWFCALVPVTALHHKFVCTLDGRNKQTLLSQLKELIYKLCCPSECGCKCCLGVAIALIFVLWTIASFTLESLGFKRQQLRATIILVVYVLLVFLWLANKNDYPEWYHMTCDAKALIFFAICSQMVQFSLVIADVHHDAPNNKMPYLEMTAPANWASFAWIFYAVAQASPKRFTYTLKEKNLLSQLAQTDSYHPNPSNDSDENCVNFQNSNFKYEYALLGQDETKLQPREIDRVMGAMRRLIEAYCTQQNIDQAHGTTFVEKLQKEWKQKDDVATAAQRLWTSAEKFEPGGGGKEFCSVYNKVIREDCASLARNSAIIARAINTNNLANRNPTARCKFPPQGLCWRGGGFDDAHRNFFVEKKKYRAPCYLATTFNESVAKRFMETAAVTAERERNGQSIVQWKIHVDPRGNPRCDEHVQYRCKHVNLISRRATHVSGETEYLFAAFSPFEVVEVAWSDVTPSTCDNPHTITIHAATDGKDGDWPEDLPLAPWC